MFCGRNITRKGVRRQFIVVEHVDSNEETTELLVMKIESVETTNQILAICVVLYVCLIIIVMVIVILDDNKLMTDYGKENYQDLYSTQSIIRLTLDNRKWNIFFWVFIPKI